MEEVYSPWDEVEWVDYNEENARGEWLADEEENHSLDDFNLKASFGTLTLEDMEGKG